MTADLSQEISLAISSLFPRSKGENTSIANMHKG